MHKLRKNVKHVLRNFFELPIKFKEFSTDLKFI